MTKKTTDAVIFDMDGTLADVSSIRHHVTEGQTDFHAFHMASVDVPAHDWVVEELHRHQDNGKAILIVTARNERYMNVTVWWNLFAGVTYDQMYFRPEHDQRPDVEVKRDILEVIRKDGFNPVHAYDDNPSIVQLWLENNIPVTVVPGWVT